MLNSERRTHQPRVIPFPKAEYAMKYVLLLGAGFSCNWDGWSASEVNDYLPTLPALRADRHVLLILQRTSGKGGFGAALAEIQDDYEKSPTA